MLRTTIAFSARIRAEDLPKLKDLARNFRKAVYELGNDSSDAVVHVNLNAFLATKANEVKVEA